MNKYMDRTAENYLRIINLSTRQLCKWFILILDNKEPKWKSEDEDNVLYKRWRWWCWRCWGWWRCWRWWRLYSRGKIKLRSATLPPSLVSLTDLRRQSKLTRNMRHIVELEYILYNDYGAKIYTFSTKVNLLWKYKYYLKNVNNSH